MDFKKYDDINEIAGFDGFISPDGSFYKVKRKRENTKTTHETWAMEYLKNNKINVDNVKIDGSIIMNLVRLESSTEKLIHLFGFVYYSHDALYYKPIIKLPNKKIFSKEVTEEQLDTLYAIMLINNENTNIPIFDGERLDYVGLEDEFNEENIYKRFK